MIEPIITEHFLLFLLGLPRLYACMLVLSFFSSSVMSGNLIRNGFVLSISLFLYPILVGTLPPFDSFTSNQILGIIAKEAIIGFCLGYIANLPFWAIDGIGHIIDNQRGASIMESMNVITNSQGSPMSNLLLQALLAIVMVTGSFLVLYRGLIVSYTVWPIDTFFPKFGADLTELIIRQFQFFFEMIILVGGPILLALFVSEMGLALISRFAPQMNVFILSLSVKSGVAIAFMALYFPVIITYFEGSMVHLDDQLFEILGAMK